jgi:hypothetical protein
VLILLIVSPWDWAAAGERAGRRAGMSGMSKGKCHQTVGESFSSPKGRAAGQPCDPPLMGSLVPASRAVDGFHHLLRLGGISIDTLSSNCCPTCNAPRPLSVKSTTM